VVRLGTELSSEGDSKVGEVSRVLPVEAVDAGEIAGGVEGRVEVGLVTLEGSGRGVALVVPGSVVGAAIATASAGDPWDGEVGVDELTDGPGESGIGVVGEETDDLGSA